MATLLTCIRKDYHSNLRRDVSFHGFPQPSTRMLRSYLGSGHDRFPAHSFTYNFGSSGWNTTLDSVVQYEARQCIIRCSVWNMKTLSQWCNSSYKFVKFISFKQPTVAVFWIAFEDISSERRPTNRKITTPFVASFSPSRAVIQNGLRTFSTSSLPRSCLKVVSFLTCTREINGSNLNRDPSHGSRAV